MTRKKDIRESLGPNHPRPPRHSTFGQSCGAQLLVRKRFAFRMLFTLSLCQFKHWERWRSSGERLFGIINNHLFWFLYYFKTWGSPVLVLWQHIRMNELLVLVISKTLKNQPMVFMKELAMNWWIYGWLLQFFIKKRSMLIHQNWVFDFARNHAYGL
jgi:hypothetical protein